MAIGSEVDIESPEPAPLQDDSVLLEGCSGGDNIGESGESGESGVGGVSGIVGERVGEEDSDPERLQRFYFESDALVLKNNIE